MRVDRTQQGSTNSFMFISVTSKKSLVNMFSFSFSPQTSNSKSEHNTQYL